MKTLFLFLITLFCLPVGLMAQTDVPLHYEKTLPQNLYVARTALVVGYETNQELTPAERTQQIESIVTKVLTDNEELGLQIVHLADRNDLLKPETKRRMLKQYDSLRVANLFFLDVTEITEKGAEGSYVMLLTAYNHSAKLMSPNQDAYTLQANSYAQLIRDLKSDLSQYTTAYFQKPAKKDPNKPLPLKPKTAQKETAIGQPINTPNKFPQISLTLEDAKRLYGNTGRNFTYFLGNDNRERNAGFFGQHLRKDIEASPDAAKQLDKYRNLKIVYLAERLIFFGAAVGYMSEVYRDKGQEYFNDNQKVYIGVAAASLLSNVILARKTNMPLHRAINEYNAFATMRNNTGFYQLKPETFGIGRINGLLPTAGLNLTWSIR